jgi:flagellar basal body-associated protein FliL
MRRERIPKLGVILSDQSTEKPNPINSPSPSKDEESIGKGAANAINAGFDEAEDLSDEDLQKIFEEEDPEFLKNLMGIGADTSLSLSEINLDDIDEELFAETEKWRTAKGWRRIAFILVPAIPKFSLKTKAQFHRLKGLLKSNAIRLKNFAYYVFVDGRKKAVAQFQRGIKRSISSAKDSAQRFSALSFRLKLMFFALIFLFFGFVYVGYLTVTGRFFPKDDMLFVTNLRNHAEEVFKYDPSTDIEPFYSNLRTTPNILLIEKMIVNLRRSETSRENPMGAFEFFLEGFSSDSLIEIKMNEAAIRDIMQREIEAFSYDDLASPDGKRRLTDELAKKVSRHIRSGRLKAVRIKTIVLNP